MKNKFKFGDLVFHKPSKSIMFFYKSKNIAPRNDNDIFAEAYDWKTKKLYYVSEEFLERLENVFKKGIDN